MSVVISSAFDAGNIRVVKTKGDEVDLAVARTGGVSSWSAGEDAERKRRRAQPRRDAVRE